MDRRVVSGSGLRRRPRLGGSGIPTRLRAVAAAGLLVAAVVLPSADGAAGAAERPIPSRVVRFSGSGGGADYGIAIASTPDGRGFFVTGSAYAGPVAGDDYATIGYTATGRRRWVSTYRGPANVDIAAAIGVAPDGDRVFVTGQSFGDPDTVTDIATVAYDADTGAELWVARYDGPAHDTDAGAGLAVSPDGATVYVTGASVGGDGSLDILTVAYRAATGDQMWEARHAGPGGDADEGLAAGVSPNGDQVYVTGYQTGSSTIDFATLAYDATSGFERWVRTIDAQGDELGRSLVVAPDGSAVYATGYRSGAPGTGDEGRHPGAAASCLSRRGISAIGADYVTVAYQATTGMRLWQENYDGPDQDCDEAYGIGVAPDGSRVIVTGSSFSLTTDSDGATVAYDAATGDQQWAARYDGPDHLYDTGDSLVIAPDGTRVYVTGYSVGATTQQDYATIFYDGATGAQGAVERYDGPGSGFDAPNAIAMRPDGGAIFVTGGSAGPGGIPDIATAIYRT